MIAATYFDYQSEMNHYITVAALLAISTMMFTHVLLVYTFLTACWKEHKKTEDL